MTRDELQDKAVEIFKKNNIFLRWITGLGKSRAIMKCVDTEKCLFVIEKLIQEDNIKKDALKFNYDISNWTFVHYNSLKKHINLQYDICCFDEADKINPTNVNYIKKINCKKFIFATAEAPKERINLFKSICNFVEFKVTLNQAIKWNILPNPKIILIGVELFSHPVIPYKGKLISEIEHLRNIENSIEYYKNNAVVWSPPDWNALTCLRKGNERKAFFNKVKLRLLDTIVNHTQNKKRIFFFGNIQDCPSHLNMYSSKNSYSKEHFINFIDNTDNTLSTVEMITRGINLPEIEVGVLMSLQKSKGNTLQKLGRLLRSDDPVIYIPYVKKTNDEKTLRNFLEDYAGEIIEL